MLNPERLALAIKIHMQSYELLRWIATAIDKGKLSVERAEHHSDTPDAAFDWMEWNTYFIPPKFLPDQAHFREFANFFWTYVTTSFDVIANPIEILVPDNGGCICPLCARIGSASHLQAKNLSKSDKRRAEELMVERLAALGDEEKLNVPPERVLDIVADLATRRSAAFSTYGQWLINRLSGVTDGPSVLALWREIASNRAGSPIQGFSLKLEDSQFAETTLVRALHSDSERQQPSEEKR
jgi:hypothetical protein